MHSELWKLQFCVDTVGLVVGGWDQDVLDVTMILSSPADYLPRPWLWHIFQILMELRWKFNLTVKETKSLRSGASWAPHGAHRIASVPVKQQNGVGSRCLAR